MTKSIELTHQIIIQQPAPAIFAERVAVLLQSLSTSSQRNYATTYEQWVDYCADANISPLRLTDVNVLAFLDQQDIGHSTRKNRLTHMRRLAEALASADHADRDIFRVYADQLRLIKVRRQTDDAPHERERQRLSPEEIYALFATFGGNSAQDVRNRALLVVLFYYGLRRFEAAGLTWSNLNTDTGNLIVLHGKGDKTRTVPIARDKPLEHLLTWRAMIPEYVYMFPRVRKNGVIGKDQPITPQAVYLIAKSLGFHPHAARGTLITAFLRAGVPVSAAQFVAGHARPDTTLHYAQESDAERVKQMLRIEY